MASRQRPKKWNSQEGCFTDQNEKDNHPGYRGQDGSQQQGQRRNSTSSSQGEGQQGRGNRNQRNNRNQNQGQRENLGQRQGNQNNRGQSHGNQINRGQCHGNQSNRGQNRGNRSNRGQSYGNQTNRGQNHGNQTNRGQYGEYQGPGPQDNRRQNQGCGCGPDNQFNPGPYPGPNPHGAGQFQDMRHPNQNYGLLPDPVGNPYNDPHNMHYPNRMQTGPYPGDYRQPMYGYGPPPMHPQPPPLMNCQPYPNRQFTNPDQRDQGRPYFDGRNGPGMMGNMERSHSSMSIDDIGSQHDGRNRNFRGRGRGGMSFDRGRGNGGMNRSSSTQSINSIGSENCGQDDRHYQGRGGLHNRQDGRPRHNDSYNGARPKQYGNVNDRPEIIHNSRNSNQQRGQGPSYGRGNRRGRGRGGNLRGNRNTLNDRNSVSSYSEQRSECTVSDDSDDNEDQDGQQRFTKSRGTSIGRRYVGRGNQALRRGRVNRGMPNFRGRGMIKKHILDNASARDISKLPMAEKEGKLEMLNKFLRSSRGAFMVSRGGRGRGRGRFVWGRWIGHLGNRRKEKESLSSVEGTVESDDKMSITSEVSTLPDSVSEGGKDGQKYEICLDDIHTVQLHTLRNRVMRYKRKLVDMRKKNEDKEEIKKYQDKVNEIKDVIQKREASEKKAMEKKVAVTSKQKDKKKKAEKATDIVERSESSSDESDIEIKLKDVQIKVKKMHSFKTAKGRVTFNPKTKKTSKKKPVNKSEIDSTDSGDTAVEEDGQEIDLEVKKGDQDKEETDNQGKVEKKKRQRNRNRKKKNVGNSGDDTGGEEKEQKLKDILGKLDSISLEENIPNKHADFNDSGLSSKSRGSSVNDSVNLTSPYSTSTVNDSFVENETPKKTNDLPSQGNNTKAKVQEKVRGGSESNANCPDVNEVFKFMVKILSGKGTPEEIKRESGIFPFDFDEKGWFRKLKRRFTVIERNGVIETVLVSNRDATYCLDYITNRSCSKADCKRYHVCKNLLAGNCLYGDRCKFSHDLLDKRNMSISKRLGYSNVFSSEEICYILQVRYPHICDNWINSGFCEEPLCIGLHLCPRYLLGQCLEGESCPLVHDKCSNHNKPIVDAYGMSDWVESIFKKMVYMKRQPGSETREEEAEIVAERTRYLSESGESASSGRNRNNSKNTQELENSASERAICDKYIVGKCRRHRCKYLHCTTLSPYLWQVKLCGQWLNFDDFEKIEKAYCENKEFSDEIRLMCNDMEFSVVIVLRPEVRAVAVVVGTQDGGIQTEARRLSTMSYKQDDDDTNNFRTQWRWFWKDDYQQWKLFDQDAMQHTLEVKFLHKQKDFNYSRENYRFKYVIDFEDMKQRNIGTRKVREISRRPIFVSQENVRGKQFPACLSAAPVVETPLPDKWVPWDLAHPFELVSIEKDSEIYTWVSDNFFRTLRRTELEIDAIFRMQNHKLRSLYCNQEKFMLANLKRLGKEGHIDRRYLFHGTDSLDAVRGISINNLDNRVSGKNATAYGDGAYFARDAKYSHAYTGTGLERFMFMVTVLVGDYTLGNRSYRRPPNKPGNDHELYDSCVNDKDNPSIFIVFDKNQYYPEYLIQYHKMYEEIPTPTVQRPSRQAAVYSHGAVGGISVGTSQPAAVSSASATRTYDPTPLVYPHRSNSSRMSVSPPRVRSSSPTRVVYPRTSDFTSSSGGHSSVKYVSHTSSNQSASRPDPPVSSPQKKNDSSCSIQ